MSGRATRRFETTRWHLVLSAGDPDAPDAQAALATLCDAYWHPVHAFLRGMGYADDDARDVTQAFFARVIERNYLGAARQTRGRFRTFLLTVLKHFVANERDAALAAKRGGRAAHVPLDEQAFDLRHRANQETPEALYERRWAEAAISGAMTRLAEKHDAPPDRRTTFERLQPFLVGDATPSYASLAAELGVAEGGLRVAVHRLRREFAACLRDVVGETVDRPEETEEELRFLLAVLAR